MTAKEPKKFDLSSMDIAAEKRKRLKQIAPEAFSETKDDDGKVIEALDFERLKSALGEFSDVSEQPKERYGMTWPDKNKCQNIIQSPSIATLKPERSESVNFDEADNLFIEGDNLEVLKLLQKSYSGQIKMIYIDPPYNTGSDFIYPDDYSESLETYLQYTGQIDGEGRKFSTNKADSGRFHTKWLNMMYPRLYTAQNLLCEDGIIFVSIDDNEVHNLRMLMNEIFGKENFVGQFVWQTKQPARGVPPTTMLMSNHEYVICYSKNIEKIKFRGEDRKEEDFSNPDNDPRGLWRSESMRSTGAKRNQFTIIDPKTKRQFSGYWAFSQKRVNQMIEDNLVIFPTKNDGVPRQKKFMDSYKNPRKAIVTSLGWFSTENATRQFMAMFNNEKVFDFPKPLDVIKFIVRQTVMEDDIVLDYFAGSCTTAHAVLDLNKDGINRKFICVQMPEQCDEKSEARKAGYQTIADIGKERIRRVIKIIESNNVKKGQDKIGFKVFKLDRSNFKVWDNAPEGNEEAVKEQLRLHVDHINPDATQEDILYELLLKAGFPLTTGIEKKEMAGKTIFSIDGGVLLICLEETLTSEVIRAMAEANPMQVICLDAGFAGNDQLKTNAVQTFKSRTTGDETHEQIVFRTV